MYKIRTIISKLSWTIEKKKLHKTGIGGYADKDHLITNPHNVEIGDHFIAGRHLQIQTWEKYRQHNINYHPKVIIGNHVSIMENCHISCVDQVSIGDGCLLGDNVFITDNFHGTGLEDKAIPPIERKLETKGPVIIGKNVWIGRNACIMPGVTIGDGAIIGANAVVTKSVENDTRVGGVPARKL